MTQEQHSSERLSRFLAHAGIVSRRQAEELIASGRVQVDGITVTIQGTRIHPDTDIVLVDGKPDFFQTCLSTVAQTHWIRLYCA